MVIRGQEPVVWLDGLDLPLESTSRAVVLRKTIESAAGDAKRGD